MNLSMQKFFFTLCFCLGIWANLAAQVQDNFSDGDFNNNPLWSGDAGQFIVDNQVLRNNGSSSDVSYLSTPNTRLGNTEWRILISTDLATTSGLTASNLFRIYLVSDQANLEGDLNGYFLELGESGDDNIRFFRQDGATTSEIATGATAFNTRGDINFRLQIKRDGAGNWQVAIDPTGNENFAMEIASVTDLTYTSTSFFGFSVEYSTSNNQAFFFDDIFVGEEIVDTEAPTLSSAQTLSQNQIALTFSEVISLATAENTVNYSANNGLGNPSAAQRDALNPRIIHLTFATNFQDALENTLTISNLSDNSGNILTPNPSTANFTFFAPVVASFREVVINEFMPDPNPVVGLPDAEFVELFNTTEQTINLENWNLSGGTIPNFILAPNQFVILCDADDVASFTALGDVIGLDSWNTLTNSGDEIRLLNDEGTLIDEVIYDNTWYQDPDRDGGGYSIEQINPNFACSTRGNWRAAQNSAGGSPGTLNSIFNDEPDTQAPRPVSASVLSPNSIEVRFSEAMAPSALLDAANYSFDQGISVSEANAGGDLDRVILSIDPEIESGITYTLTINNLTDCSENALSENTLTLLEGFTPTFHELLITEIMADPSGSAQPLNSLPETEFIEIFNNSDRIIDLKGCRFLDQSSTITLPQQALNPGEYIIVVEEAFFQDFQSFGRVLPVENFPALTNGGELIQLQAPDGSQVFAVAYSDVWYQDSDKADGGFTLEMLDTNNPCGEENNWLASEAERGGTPGQVNSVATARPDLTAPRLFRAEALNTNLVRLTFDERMDKVSLENAAYTIEGGANIAVQSVQVEEPLFKRVFLSLDNALEAQTSYTIAVANSQDCSTNLISSDIDNSAIFGLAEAGDSSDVLLNEILFNPRTGSVDFVEVYNNSSKFINLSTWKLANADEDLITNQREIISDDFIITPASYTVFTTSTARVLLQYPNGLESNFLEVSALPSYPDSDGTVVLINDRNQLLERFDYEEDFHFPLLDDEEGVSLERIAFDLPTNTPNSWQSAASTAGFATPGLPNSQVRAGDIPNVDIAVIPEVITPDGDGDADFTTFNVRFNQGGFVINQITIFDSRGREVKQLVERELLGSETATFVWDGTNNSGGRARAGYYVAFIQVFDLNGQEETFKKTLVVARRF